LYGDGLSAPRPTPKQGNHPLSAVGDYFIHSQELSISGGRLLRPQPHDASCRTHSSRIPASWLQWNQPQTNELLYKLIWTRRDSSDNGRCLFFFAGLFHRVILMSGSVTSPWSGAQRPANSSRGIARSLGCLATSSRAILSCLRTKSTAEILRAFESQYKVRTTCGKEFCAVANSTARAFTK
jgi:hypothetical protein